MIVLLIRGNPRKNGLTQYVTEFVLKGMRSTEVTIKEIDVTRSCIKRCVGCYACWTKTPGCCFHQDDMPHILELLFESDIILCASPLYCYGMSSSLQIFFERLLPLTKNGLQLGDNTLYRNNVRFPERWERKNLALVCTGALKNIENFHGLRATFKLLAHGLHMNYGGALFRPESFILPFSTAQPKIINSIKNALIEGGRELVTGGSFSQGVKEKVSQPLTTNSRDFEKYSQLYWDHVTSLGNGEWDIETVQNKVLNDVRLLVYEMVKCIDPHATKKVKAIYQFDFPDKHLFYTIKIHNGIGTLHEGCAKKFDVRISTQSDTWVQVVNGKLAIKDALFQNKISIEGDKVLFRKLGRYFPPP